MKRLQWLGFGFCVFFSTALRAGENIKPNDPDIHYEGGKFVSKERPPNIVMIMADDLGYEILNCYGGRSYQTPRLDQLAAEGMKFTHAFSTPYCSPSRAQLLTGRYPLHNGIKRVIFLPDKHREFLDPGKETGFANLLQDRGYATAIAGKWQISFLYERDTVRDFGFDQYQCWKIMDPTHEKNSRYFDPVFVRNGETIEEELKGRYGPDVNVEFLIKFMKENKDRPFMAYHTMLLPHFPWGPTPDSKKILPRVADGLGNPDYFPDMVAYMDQLVGRVVDAVDELGLKEKTVIFFTGDNGTQKPLTSRWGADNRIVPGGKGDPSDAGTRVPLIARWPGKIKAGTVNKDLIDFSDLLPTFVELTQSELPEQPINGRSFVPQLLGEQGESRKWVHIQKQGIRYVRSRDWILTDKGDLRPVVEIGHAPAPAIVPPGTTDQQRVRKELRAALKSVVNYDSQ